MLRKLGMILSVALLLMLSFAVSVAAQTPPTADDEEPVIPLFDPIRAAVAQAVPVTLTLTLPGPTGTITVDVPIMLVLDIRIGIGDSITTAVSVTPSQIFTQTEPVTRTPAAAVTPTPAATSTPAATPTALPTTATTGATLTPTPAATEAPVAEEEETVAEEEAEPAAPTSTPLPPPTTAPADTPTPEPTPTEEGEEVAEALPPACDYAGASITSPGVNEVVSGTVNILGTATHPNFLYYKVEYAPGAGVSPDDSFAYLFDAREQVQGGVLATFDSTQFDNGPYTFMLTVVDNTGNFPPPCTVSVVVQN